ncbi:uncharacterized protein LOC129946218 [Eupeodes corollae]|uniref:uncharacterized protein LOC129946218 n=1 Tax=Eupeodes corollae TaxID=290404 RepID=UPI002491458F|nr:uncharacterized protein LOC129946218 [Eupeodes corollae]
MFLNTFSISAQTIRTVFEKIAMSNGIILSPDKRGQHFRPVNELRENSKMFVKEHIELFPLVESHYCRKDSNKKYLSNEIKSVGEMFRLYEEWFESRGYDLINKVTLRQYRDIFNFNFNLSFYVPKKDQCDFCLKYENMTPEEKIASKFENDQHLFNKQKARELKEADKTAAQASSATVTACFDFEKILSTTTANASCFYYKRKLEVYNFTVYELASHEANCYVWDETIAKKGCVEVSNCLLKFIEEYVTKGVRNFHFWSDNCGGQNKNKVLFGFFGWASKNFKVNITHRFLEKGHTQNEGDSVHALIEKSQKNKIVYTPIQWYSIIRNAKTKEPVYKVTEMIQDDFKDFKTFSYSLNWIKNTGVESAKSSCIQKCSATTKTILRCCAQHQEEWSNYKWSKSTPNGVTQKNMQYNART